MCCQPRAVGLISFQPQLILQNGWLLHTYWRRVGCLQLQCTPTGNCWCIGMTVEDRRWCYVQFDWSWREVMSCTLAFYTLSCTLTCTLTFTLSCAFSYTLACTLGFQQGLKLLISLSRFGKGVKRG